MDQNGDILIRIIDTILLVRSDYLEHYTAVDETTGRDIEVEDDVSLDEEDCLVVLDEDGQEAGVDRHTEEGTHRVKHPGLAGSH